MPEIITPAGAPPPEITLPSVPNPHIRPQSQHSTPQKPRNHRASPNPRKTPSPSSSYKKQNSPPMDESALDNPDLGPFLLKLAHNTIASGESPVKALEHAIRASKSFERFEEMKLDLAMSLHVTAAIYCSLGKYGEAVPVLEWTVAVPEMERGGARFGEVLGLYAAGRYVFDDWESGSEY